MRPTIPRVKLAMQVVVTRVPHARCLMGILDVLLTCSATHAASSSSASVAAFQNAQSPRHSSRRRALSKPSAPDQVTRPSNFGRNLAFFLKKRCPRPST